MTSAGVAFFLGSGLPRAKDRRPGAAAPVGENAAENVEVKLKTIKEAKHLVQ
jgi:hypothetical protein